MQFIKEGVDTYQVIDGHRLLIDADDNYDVTADGGIVPKQHRLASKLEFRCLFTTDELIGLDNYAQNSGLTAEQKAAMLTVTKNFDCANEIDLCDSRTSAALEYIESIGLIASGRAAQILASRT